MGWFSTEGDWITDFKMSQFCIVSVPGWGAGGHIYIVDDHEVLQERLYNVVRRRGPRGRWRELSDDAVEVEELLEAEWVEFGGFSCVYSLNFLVGVRQVEYVFLAMGTMPETVPETMCRKHISWHITIHITYNEPRSSSVTCGYISWALPIHLTHRVRMQFWSWDQYFCRAVNQILLRNNFRHSRRVMLSVFATKL